MHNEGWTTTTKWHSNNDTYMQKMNWHTFTQMYPPQVEASGGQEEYYIRSSWHSGECNWECIGYIVQNFRWDVPPK